MPKEKLNDLKITCLCAQAMGYDLRNDKQVRSKWDCSVIAFDGNHFVFNPLHDDGQTLLLIKKFELDIQGPSHGNGGWLVDSELINTHNKNLNRAVCECIAEMQRRK